MSEPKRDVLRGSLSEREFDELIDIERDRLEFELELGKIMAEPDSPQRQRKIAWIMAVREKTNRERAIEKILAARIAEWKHEIAVYFTIWIAIMTSLLVLAALNGVPVFTAKMAWGVIVIAVISLLSKLWG